MAKACKYCIMTRGLRGSEIANLPQTDEELYGHIEREHHIPVGREGESEEQTKKRFQEQNPEAGGPNCRCPACQAKHETMMMV